EVFAFGEGVALPTRLKFKELAKEFIPRSESLGHSRVDADQALDTDFIAAVVQRWRGAMMQQKGASESESSPLDDLDSVAAGEFVRVPQGRADPPAHSSDPLSGYGRNAGARLDSYAGVQPVQGHSLRGLRK